MEDENLKKIWQDKNIPTEKIIIHPLNLTTTMDTQLQKFEKDIKKRNNREIGVAMVLIPIFGYYAYSIPPTLSKIGSVLLVLYALFVIYKLKKVNKNKPSSDTSSSIKAYLVSYKSYIAQERLLLKNVLYWYLLPAIPGMVLFKAGFGFSGGSLLYGLGVCALCIGVYLFNQKAVREQFDPLLVDISEAIRQLEEEG